MMIDGSALQYDQVHLLAAPISSNEWFLAPNDDAEWWPSATFPDFSISAHAFARRWRRSWALGAPTPRAPEFPLSGQKQVLVQGIGMEFDLHPFSPAGDDREDGGAGSRHPHTVLQLRHMFFGRRFLREGQGSMNLASNTAPVGSTRPSSVAAIRWWTGWRTSFDSP